MHISFTAHNPKNYGTSCRATVEYLTKEDYEKDQSYFFNNDNQLIESEKAFQMIDDNKGSHSNSVSKFYMINISPSKQELEHLEKLADEYLKRNREQVDKQEVMKQFLQEYTNEVMKEYAKNFNKDLQIDDLVYVAKVETERTHKANDKYVLHNKKIDQQIARETSKKKIQKLEEMYKRNPDDSIIRENQKKQGLNYHVHVIVSRYERNGSQRGKRSLSPMSQGKRSKGLNNSDIGFCRDDFSQNSEKTFDKTFEYNRQTYEEYQERKQRSKEKSKEQETNGGTGAGNILVDYYKGIAMDALRENKAIDSKIPLSLNELFNNVSYNIEQTLGIREILNPRQTLSNEIKKVIDFTDKGVDLGY